MPGAYIRIELVRLLCMDKSVSHPRVALGHRRVVYRHYLPELARKSLALRQVASATQYFLKAPYSLYETR